MTMTQFFRVIINVDFLGGEVNERLKAIKALKDWVLRSLPTNTAYPCQKTATDYHVRQMRLMNGNCGSQSGPHRSKGPQPTPARDPHDPSYNQVAVANAAACAAGDLAR